jgi:hypothetical protein
MRPVPCLFGHRTRFPGTFSYARRAGFCEGRAAHGSRCRSLRRFSARGPAGATRGALSVRWAWLFGSGASPEEGQVSRPWAKKVNRIVLIAGLNRGFVVP